MPSPLDMLLDDSRLKSVSAVLPTRSGPDENYDRIARLASQALLTPTSFVTLIGATDQHFRGVCGAPDVMGDTRSGPHAHSLCLRTVLAGRVYSIDDADKDPSCTDNPIVQALSIKAYLGIPLVTTDGQTLGSICVIDYSPRYWTEPEIDRLRDHAAVAVGQLEAELNTSKARVALDLAIHDIKTPLCGLEMASKLVGERISSVPEDIRPLFEIVKSSTSAAMKLVETLAEKQKNRDSVRCGNPVSVAEGVLKEFQFLADSKNIRLEAALDKVAPLALPSWVLERILENLVSNAVKYSPGGSIVWITSRMESGLGQFIVRDQGPGFSKEDRSRLYNRYQRLSASPTGGESSTGLGLSIVKRLVEQYGGAIELLSGVGQGAEFRISVPLA